MHQETLEIATSGRGLTDITGQVADAVRRSGVESGLCQLFLQHTSAGLLITENADPDVLSDLETWMSDAAPDGDPRFLHTAEGPDDMSAHVRSLLTGCQLTIPIQRGRLALGTWQGVFVWEHRARAHRRQVMVSVG
ncbi:MAG: secondary thiamine-phosphate synthase enzyme YjbQ [Wenzhouxiangellaceae bacterium]